MEPGSTSISPALMVFLTLLTSLVHGAPVDDERRHVTYIMLGGNCPGAFLVDVSLQTLDECKQHCGVLPQCAGFSYSPSRDLCFLKKQSCEEPILGSEFVFYQKFDPAHSELPKLLAENQAEDPAAVHFKNQQFYQETSVSHGHNVSDYNNDRDFYPRVDNSMQMGNELASETGSVISMMSSNRKSVGQSQSMRQALPTITVPNPDCSKNAGSNSEFILMFMFNMPDRPQNFDLEIYVSGDPSPNNVATEVQIVMPRFPSYPGDRGTVSPGQTVLFKLPLTVGMTQTGIESKAVRVLAKNPNAKISVYAINKETYTADGFLVFPTASLGLEHYVLTWQPSTRGSEFGIATPYDGTIVQIVLPPQPPPGSDPAIINYNGRSYTNGDAIQLSLQANDAFLAINDNLNSDLTGTRVISSKPIAVFSGDKRTAIKYISGSPPTRDHLVEQLPPVQAWGSEFVFCTSPNRTDGDFMKIVASQDATGILVYGGLSGAQQRTLTAAGTFVLIETAPQECLYISSTKPVMVGKFVVSQKPDQTAERTDPAAVVVPPTSTYRSGYAFMTPTYAGLTQGEQYLHFILIGVKKEHLEGFIVDGAPATLQQIVPTYKDYICGYLMVSPGSHNIQHVKTDAKFLAILYGAADRESYAFVLGETLPSLCQDKPTCKPGNLLGSCPYCQEAQVAQGCYGQVLSLTCPSNRVVKVVSAHYGWFPGLCTGSSCGAVPHGNCGMYNVYDNIARFCNGQSGCNFPVATNALFTGPQFSNYFCPLCSTRVVVYYTCVVSSSLACANLVGRTPLFVRYTASTFWRREPGRGDITCPDDISMLTPVDVASIPAYLPEFARYAAPHGLMWCPSECDTNSSYIQVDLGRVLRVTGYAIQGRIGYEQWVSAVAIDYSSDGRTWVSVGNQPDLPPQISTVGGGTTVWDANNDPDNVMVCDLSLFAVDARFFRLWIRGYEGYPCMRLDIFTCNDVPQQGSNKTFNDTTFPFGQAFPIFPPDNMGASPKILSDGPSSSTKVASTLSQPLEGAKVTSTRALPDSTTTTTTTTTSTRQSTQSSVTTTKMKPVDGGSSNSSTTTARNSNTTTSSGGSVTVSLAPNDSETTTQAEPSGSDDGSDGSNDDDGVIAPDDGDVAIGDDGSDTDVGNDTDSAVNKKSGAVPPSFLLLKRDQKQKPQKQRLLIRKTKAPIPPGCPRLTVTNSDVADKFGTIGQKIIVHCFDDWMLPDFNYEFTATCESSGSWTGVTYQCTEPRNCGPIPDIDHARYVVNKDPNRVAGSVTYTCDPGYKLVGTPTVTCQSNTLWTSIPHCEEQ